MSNLDNKKLKLSSDNFEKLKELNDMLLLCDAKLKELYLKYDGFFYFGKFVSSDLFAMSKDLNAIENALDSSYLKKKDIDEVIKIYNEEIAKTNLEIEELNKKIYKVNLILDNYNFYYVLNFINLIKLEDLKK